MTRIGAVLGALVLAAPLLAGCGGSEEATDYNPEQANQDIRDAVSGGLVSPKVTVLSTLEHATDAWTEGLEIADGKLYESTGLAGRSELRELDPKTGKLLRSAPLPSGYFGEGITVLGSLVWQLTYRDGVALQWNRETLNAGGRVPWSGEGWGLCHTPDDVLVASDGTDRLRVIDSNGTDELDSLNVTVHGRPLAGLNELECGKGVILANVWKTDWVVAINPESGAVFGAVNLANLFPAADRGGADVLNGIAAVPGSANTYLVTGKNWPKIFRVRFAIPGVPSAAAPSPSDAPSRSGGTRTTSPRTGSSAGSPRSTGSRPSTARPEPAPPT